MTLADVAAVAGVSEITVSRVLRNRGTVAAETRGRVLRAVARVGYVTNPIAGAMASSASNLVGVIVPSLDNVVFPEVLSGINAGLAGTGLATVVSVSGYERAREEALVRELLAWRPAALLLPGGGHTPGTRLMLETSAIRVAELMDSDITPVDLAVGLSHREVGRASIRHLLGRGYRRFGYVGHDWDRDQRARIRFFGMEEELRAAGLSFAGLRRHAGPSAFAAGRETLAQLLAAHGDIEVAVFSNDDMAAGGVFHCLAAGIPVPDRLALFGFNGLEVGRALPQPLSTMRSNRFAIGRRAIERLLAGTQRSGGEIIDTGFELVAGATA